MIKQTFASALLLWLAACSGSPEEDGATQPETAEHSDPAKMANGEPAYGHGDAKVSGTDYNATASVKCGFGNTAPTQSCDAGVKRNWGEDGTTLVEVQKPDGFKRAIFFKGTEPYGADSAQADGSAGWEFKTSREGDLVTIKFGPETYVIVDAFVEGG